MIPEEENVVTKYLEKIRKLVVTPNQDLLKREDINGSHLKRKNFQKRKNISERKNSLRKISLVKLKSIKNADVTFVMKKGTMLQNVLKKGKKYKKMVKMLEENNLEKFST